MWKRCFLVVMFSILSLSATEAVKALFESDAEKEVVSAAERGDSVQLAKILKERPWLAKPPHKPLHAAASKGDRKCVELLLAHGADPNLDYGFGNVLGPFTPLSDAVTGGHYEVTKLLLEHGAKTRVSGGKNHDSLFHYAIGFRDIRFMKVMLEHKADPDEADHGGLTPLHVAVEVGELDKVKLLLSFRANVNATTKDEATPLFFAAVRRHRDIGEYLLSQGARLDIYSACALDKRAEALALLEKIQALLIVKINGSTERLSSGPSVPVTNSSSNACWSSGPRLMSRLGGYGELRM